MNVLSDLDLDQLLMFLAEREQFVFLDTARPDHENCTSLLFLNPLSRLQCRRGDDSQLFLAQVESALAAGHYVAGWFGYEFGYLLEERLQGLLRRSGEGSLLLADLGIFGEPFFFDHCSGQSDFPGLEQASGPADRSSHPNGASCGASTIGASNTGPSLAGVCQVSNIRPSQNREAYLQAIEAIQQYIVAGDTYQVNYTLKLLFDFCGTPEALYKILRRNQSVAYGAYLHLGEQRLLSFSPELFFRKNAEGIMVRPMKGTMKRGRFPEEDVEQVRHLRDDQKNRSENVMIVDLLRNDLGRLMHDLGDGTVHTRSLFDIERYETLLQMTSTVIVTTVQDSGHERLASPSLSQLFQALFPCGSVTGAPKIRTMEIINELESGRRGVYTGAIGYLAPSGTALFNVPIRTVTLCGAQGEMGIGSGIVADSVPEQEWQECLLKGRFLTSSAPPFQLIETLLWEPGSGYWLLAEHLERLRASADYFLFQCDLPFIEHRLREESCLSATVPLRVRLTLAKDGAVAVSSHPCSRPVARCLPREPDLQRTDLPRIDISPVPTESSLPWYFHKTTRRELYDHELQRARGKGLFDCCFVNERAELTEGCISNIILYRKGVYVTPSLQCGLLAGIMRKNLLADVQIPLREEVLTLADLRQAEALFLCNSVRGVVQVTEKREFES